MKKRLIDKLVEYIYWCRDNLDLDQCYEWRVSIYKSMDRGTVSYMGQTMSASKATYIKFKGRIDGNFMVLHKCVNSICVNPDHLYLGNHSDNANDSIKKGKIVYLNDKPILKKRFFRN